MIAAPSPVIVAIAQTPQIQMKFEVGQKLRCVSAHADRLLEASVGRVDTAPNGATVVSITLEDKAPGGQPNLFAHMPFDATALASSCRQVIATDVPVRSEFNDGYATWREAFDAGKGGYFTISVDQAIDFVKSILAGSGADHHA